MPLRPPDISAALLLLLVGNAVVVAGADAEASSGYEYGQNVPVSCLNRDIETGEHITDQTGNLQYIPFPTCNETSSPLAFHYGVSETITCTIPSISDPLYHLFEYYVHADVPMACRIPTTPLSPAVAAPVARDRRAESGEERHDSTDGDGKGVGGSIPFTPLTIALQGTLQLSHLHMWTDMNVVLHQSVRLSSLPPSSPSSSEKQKQKKKKNKKKHKNKGKKDPLDPTGHILSGAAYSVPLVLPPLDSDDTNNKKPLPKNPWSPGSGAKIIRGEPLTFTFRVGWMATGDVLELDASSPSHSRSSSSSGMSGFTLWVVICFVMGVGVAVGMVIARGGGKGGFREGILGRTAPGARKGGYGLGGYGLNGGGGGNGVGVGIGNGGGGGGGGGYGGYGGYGYGGYSGVGKRD